jgi:hypothetical protein
VNGAVEILEEVETIIGEIGESKAPLKFIHEENILRILELSQKRQILILFSICKMLRIIH